MTWGEHSSGLASSALRTDISRSQIGANLATQSLLVAGGAYTVSSLGFTFTPARTGNLTVTFTANVWLRAALLNLFAGWGSSFAGLRVYIETPDGQFTGRTAEIYNVRGIFALDIARHDSLIVSASHVVSIRRISPIGIFIDAVQSVFAAGAPHLGAVSNMSARVFDVNIF
jgi:hypothetical protein